MSERGGAPAGFLWTAVAILVFFGLLGVACGACFNDDDDDRASTLGPWSTATSGTGSIEPGAVVGRGEVGAITRAMARPPFTEFIGTRTVWPGSSIEATQGTSRSFTTATTHLAAVQTISFWGPSPTTPKTRGARDVFVPSPRHPRRPTTAERPIANTATRWLTPTSTPAAAGIAAPAAPIGTRSSSHDEGDGDDYGNESGGRYGNGNRQGRCRGNNCRGSFSPGPFDRSPVDVHDNCVSLDCGGSKDGGPPAEEHPAQLFPPSPAGVRDFVLATVKSGIELGRVFSDVTITFVENLLLGLA